MRHREAEALSALRAADTSLAEVKAALALLAPIWSEFYAGGVPEDGLPAIWGFVELSDPEEPARAVLAAKALLENPSLPLHALEDPVFGRAFLLFSESLRDHGPRGLWASL